jgi:hypothetical protein
MRKAVDGNTLETLERLIKSLARILIRDELAIESDPTPNDGLSFCESEIED